MRVPPSVLKPYSVPTLSDYRPRGPPREPNAPPHREATSIEVLAAIFERTSLSPPPPRRARPWGSSCPAPARRTRAHSGATSGPAGTPRRPAPAGRQPPRFPDRQPRRPPRVPRMAQFPIVRGSAQKRPFWDADSPRVMPETACKSKSWKWWPGTESNHRHADFQSNGEPGSVRVRRRLERDFPWADRTAPRDRAYPEPCGARADRTPARGPCGSTGLAPSRPSGDRTAHAERGPRSPALSPLATPILAV